MSLTENEIKIYESYNKMIMEMMPIMNELEEEIKIFGIVEE